ncbi:hypothetical protein J6590_092558 [Homalodisca vitripennis]|nr:hypothetical protein J6590_092558 [Homalodisca vitripennis]
MWTRQGEHAVCASHSNCALKLRCGPNQRTLLDQPSMTKLDSLMELSGVSGQSDGRQVESRVSRQRSGLSWPLRATCHHAGMGCCPET